MNIRSFARIRAFVAVILAVIVLVAGHPTNAADSQPAFFSSIDDLPLMAGLTEDTESSVVFDTPAGRIAEVYARGRIEASRIRAFYAATLPQLGWQQRQPGSFRRDSEELRVEVVSSGTPSPAAGEVLVRFALSPTAPAGK